MTEEKQYEQKNNTGAIFRNEKKTEETHSDYNGTAKIAEKEYWVNAWVNTSKAGKKYMQIKFVHKEKASPTEQKGENIEDSLPF